MKNFIAATLVLCWSISAHATMNGHYSASPALEKKIAQDIAAAKTKECHFPSCTPQAGSPGQSGTSSERGAPTPMECHKPVAGLWSSRGPCE